MALAWQLAVARIPRNRAVLEQLVRERTGLELSFGELSLRWGWYGPEAIFRRVELQGEHGEALLRAPELIVGLDAWHVLHGGQLDAGRIRIVNADIDLRQPLGASLSGAAGAAHRVAGNAGAVEPSPLRTAVLQTLMRWHEGRVDLDSATLHLPDADSGGPEPWVLQLRQGALRRAGNEWSAYGVLLLPAPLGRSARVVMRIEGDPARPAELAGSVRLDGTQLELGTWSRLLARWSSPGDVLTSLAASASGAADLELAASFAGGRMTRAQGRLDALHVAARPGAGRGELRLPRLRAQWHALRRGEEWRVGVDGLDLGSGPRGALASASLWSAPDAGLLRATVHDLPLEPAAGLLAALGLPVEGLATHGTAQVLNIDWSEARAAAERLEISGELAAPRLELPGAGMSLTGTAARLRGTPQELRILPASGSAAAWRAQLPGGDAQLAIAGELRLSREGEDLSLAAHDLQIAWDGAHLRLDGGLARGAAAPAALDVKLAGLDLDRLRAVLGAQAWRRLAGPLGESLRGTVSLDAELGPPDPGGEGLRVAADVHEARWSPVPELPPVEALAGRLLYENGQLQRSTLQGRWLGGPLSVQLRERVHPGGRELLAQLRGRLDAAALDAPPLSSDLTGSAEWVGSLAYAWDPSGQEPAQLHWRADSRLLGVQSRLADPFAKSAGSVLRLRAEASGTAEQLSLRASLGERLGSVWQLQRGTEGPWRVERAALRTGRGLPGLPAEDVVLIEGTLGRIDLPAYLGAWRWLRTREGAPRLRAELTAAELRLGRQTYANVRLQAQDTPAAQRLRVSSDGFEGELAWPRAGPAELRLARLELTDPASAGPSGASGGADMGWIEALPPATELRVESLLFHGRELGAVQGTLLTGTDHVRIPELKLSGAAHVASGDLDCSLAACRLKLAVQGEDLFALLPELEAELGVRARGAKLRAELQWQQPAVLATLSGQLHIELQDGAAGSRPDSAQPAEAASTAAPPGMGILAAPALVAREGGQPLRFERLAGDFELQNGVAWTSDLQLEGDSEMLISGRVSLVARDYDQRVWILRGEDRLPAAVRRLAVTPGVAAAWLSLRQMFTGSGSDPLALHLGGSWEEPVLGPLRQDGPSG